MDPSVCVNPTFHTPGAKANANTTEVSDEVSQKLFDAIQRIQKQIERSELEPPHPIIEIAKKKGKCIVVKEIYENSKRYLIIYHNADSKDVPMFKESTNKFRHVQFSFLEDCRIFILSKMVRVFFMRCKGCQISIRTPLIESLEFFECKNSSLNVRIPEGEISRIQIPLVLIENCPNFDIYQSNRELVYIIKLSDRVTGNIIDPKTKERLSQYNLGKTIWDEQERRFVLFSRDQGFSAVPDRYSLHSLSHHLMIKPLNSVDSLDPTDVKSLFGTTPPVAKDSPLRRWKD